MAVIQYALFDRHRDRRLVIVLGCRHHTVPVTRSCRRRRLNGLNGSLPVPARGRTAEPYPSTGSRHVDRRSSPAVSLYSRQRWDGDSRGLSMLLSPGPPAAKPAQVTAEPPAAGAGPRFCSGRRGCGPGWRGQPLHVPPDLAAAGHRRQVRSRYCHHAWRPGGPGPPVAAGRGLRRSAGRGAGCRPCPYTCRRTPVPPGAGQACTGTWPRGPARRLGMPAAARPPPAVADARHSPWPRPSFRGADAGQSLIPPRGPGGSIHG
jgi:hypothetical protein